MLLSELYKIIVNKDIFVGFKGEDRHNRLPWIRHWLLPGACRGRANEASALGIQGRETTKESNYQKYILLKSCNETLLIGH